MNCSTRISVSLIIICGGYLFAQTGNYTMGLKNLYQLSDAKSRSISPENFTGDRGKGGMADLEEGSAAHAAGELGQGWKVNPYVIIKPGETFTMGEIIEAGVINQIWMTPTGDYRLAIFRIYWDGEEEASVESPVGDFFVSGWGWGNEPDINSLAICVNPKNGFNSYWQMPFRKKCKITMENRSSSNLILYYQINYSLMQVPDDAAYFHAQFRKVDNLPFKQDYTIVDGIAGRGHYVGTYLAHAAKSPGWWGEGEIKFFMDGDTKFPTICGTGEEDYFCGSYGYEMRGSGRSESYTNFSTAYAGFHHVIDPNLRRKERRFGQYRWHITDPIRFEKDLRVTIQCLGWREGGRYLPLRDDLASVAYWYQTEPHIPFPELPENDKLILINSDPVNHLAKGAKIELLEEPSTKYQSDPAALLNGLLGSNRFNDGQWIGFEGNDLAAIVDLGKKTAVSKISISFLNDQNAWIFLPQEVTISVSTDGKKYTTAGVTKNQIKEDGKPTVNSIEQKVNKVLAQYIKIEAANIKTCPEWHQGAGGKAWIFVDEIIVE